VRRRSCAPASPGIGRCGAVVIKTPRVPKKSNHWSVGRSFQLFKYYRTMVPVNELEHPAREAIVLEDVLFALSDPVRLDLVRQLRESSLTAASCTTLDPSVPKSTKSHMFKVLRE